MQCEKCSKAFDADDIRSYAHRPSTDHYGTKRYGKLCKRCYKAKASTEGSRRFRENNRELDRKLKRESAKRRRKEAPELFKNKKQWSKTNPEGWKAWQREYGRRYRAEHPEQIKATKARFVQKHGQEYVNQQVLKGVHRRRAKLRGSKFDTVAWELMKQEYDFTCLWCQRREPEIKLTPDHVIPVSKGGADTIDNIQPLCLDCNRHKNARCFDFRRVLTS